MDPDLPSAGASTFAYGALETNRTELNPRNSNLAVMYILVEIRSDKEHHRTLVVFVGRVVIDVELIGNK